MKTWNVYQTSDWSLLDVVTSADDKELWDVKTWWWETSNRAHFLREHVGTKFDPKYDLLVEEPNHFGGGL